MPRKEAQRIVPEMLDEFERELTDPVLERLLSFAKRRVEMLAKAGVRRTPDDANALLRDVITDTLTRVVTWDPRRVRLDQHLRLVMKTRSLNRLHQVTRTPHKSLEDSVDGDLTVAAASFAAARTQDGHAVADVALSVLADVRSRAAGDGELLAVLDAYEAGCQDRGDVIARTGMSPATYVNARRRLDRMLASLPAEMQDDVRETLGRKV